MANLKFTNVDKIYEGNVQAVTDFNLDIDDKQFVVFVGPSGCGKSTTLRMVAGLEEITRGEVRIDDRVINDVPPKDRDIAMVFQNYALYPHMTVRENMGFGLKLRGFPKIDIEARVREASDILGLDDLLNRTPAALSGGQRQRVAMGRAIVRKPKVFLFDEPLSNLDAKLRVKMRGEISKLHTKLQTTLIYVTHDQVEAMTMGDVIVVMKDGLIQQVADPITLYNHPVNKFVAGFIGTPPMNFFDVELKKEGNYIYAHDGDMKIRLSSDIVEQLTAKNFNKTKVSLGIRPEDIYMKDSYPGTIEDNVCNGTIEVVEPLGSISYIYVNNGNTTFIARGTNDIMHSSVGKKIELVFDMFRAKIFDNETEETIVDLKY